jgi:hypothetical protein
MTLFSCEDPVPTTIELEQFMYLSLTGAKEMPVIKKLNMESTADTTFFIGISYGGTTNYERGDISAVIDADLSLIDAFNAANNTAYLPLPAETYSLDGTTLRIDNGSNRSSVARLTIHMSVIDMSYDYILPVTVKSVSGGNLPLNEEYSTIYLVFQGDVDVNFTPDPNTFNGPHILSDAATYELLAADFNYGGEGVGFHDVSGQNWDNPYRIENGDDLSFPVLVSEYNTCVGYTADGEWLLYSLEVRDAGIYTVDFSVSGIADASFYCSIDDVNSTMVTAPSNGDWGSWYWVCETYGDQTQPTFLLSAGIHKFKFHMKTDGFNIRAYKFTRIGDFNTFNGPHILSDADPYELLAADFDYGGEGVGFHDVSSQNWGGTAENAYREENGDYLSYPVLVSGYNLCVGYTAEGEWLSYSLEVKDAGVYAVDFSVSGIGNSSFYCSMDDVNSTTLTAPSNGDWTTWYWLCETYGDQTQPTFRLSAGMHRFKFHENTDGFNIRAYKFTRIGD